MNRKKKNSIKKLTLEKLNITKLNRNQVSIIGGTNTLLGDTNNEDGGNTTLITDWSAKQSFYTCAK